MKKRTEKKKKNSRPVPAAAPRDESVAGWRRSFALRRRQAGRERTRQNAELERQRVFRRKLREASDKKAPRTLRTRAYYRFSRDYPETENAEGFRENAPDPRRRRRAAIRAAILCVAAFCAAFVVTRAMRYISAQPPENAAPDVTEAAYEPAVRILRIPRDALAAGDADAILALAERSGCNAVLLEIKDEDGRLLVRPEGGLYADTDRLVPGSEDTVAALKQAGLTVCGYISCFLDPAAARADEKTAVRRAGDGGVWTDNAGRGWLNPFSADATDYLLRVADAAIGYGVDALMLDHVEFSSDSGGAPARYPGENDGADTRGSVLTSFVNAVVKKAEDVRVILTSSFSSFDAAAQPDAVSLLGTGAGALCTDARLSRQKMNVTVGEEVFRDVSQLPYPFTLAVGTFTAENALEAGSTAKRYLCIESGPSLAAQKEAAVLLRADGIVIW